VEILGVTRHLLSSVTVCLMLSVVCGTAAASVDYGDISHKT
jgi:hypothetical protein